MATVETSRLVHDAFVYDCDEEFLSGTMPFLEEGLELGEPILAAPTQRNTDLLQTQLGDRAEAVDWAEAPESHRAVERLAIFLDYIEAHLGRGTTRIRLLGEPCWPSAGRPGAEEWKRYESFLNVALESYPVWLVCPYDGSSLAPDVVQDACLTHPTIGYGDRRHLCADYLDPVEFAHRIDSMPLPRPPDGALERYIADAGSVRRFVGERARAAGLRDERLRDAELAVGEVAANVFRHAAEVARVRTWVGPETFVCDVDDTGHGIDDPFAGYARASPTAPDGRGLTIARRFADTVEIRRLATGTLVRLHFWLR